MKIAIYLATIQLRIADLNLLPLMHARRVMRGLAKGIARADPSTEVALVDSQNLVRSDFAVMFGWTVPGATRDCYRLRQRLVDAFDDDPTRLLVMETPVLGRRVDTLRHGWWRMGCGGMTRAAEFLNNSSPADRWQRQSTVLKIYPCPYRKDGSHILVLGQKSGDASLFGLDMRQWLASTIADIRKHSERPVVLRLHPREKQMDASDFPNVTISTNKSVLDDLRGAWAAVTYSSGSAIDALLAGIPVFTLSEHSLAYTMGNHDLNALETPRMPGRQQWLNDLSYAQWSNAELSDGTYWRQIMRRHPAYAHDVDRGVSHRE